MSRLFFLASGCEHSSLFFGATVCNAITALGFSPRVSFEGTRGVLLCDTLAPFDHEEGASWHLCMKNQGMLSLRGGAPPWSINLTGYVQYFFL